MKVCFVLRNAPDWHGLSKLYDKNGYVDPSLYLPRDKVPCFPKNVPHFIDVWNDTLPVSYFKFRSVLSDVSRAYVKATGCPSFSISCIPNDTNTLVYFHDDDDLFSSEITGLTLPDGYDVTVTPLLRIDPNNYFLFSAVPVTCGIEVKANTYRYNTNNYGIRASVIADAPGPRAYEDHIRASTYAKTALLKDSWCNTVVSATIKTPASASILPRSCKSPESLIKQLSKFDVLLGSLLTEPLHSSLVKSLTELRVLTSDALSK